MSADAISMRQRLGRTTRISDPATVVVVGLVVWLIFPERNDWAAHVVAGGGAVIAFDGLVAPRLGRWSAPLGALAVLLAAIAIELVVRSPFDAGDVAFTAAGAILVVGERPGSVGGWSQAERVLWGSALVAGAVALRYWIDL